MYKNITYITYKQLLELFKEIRIRKSVDQTATATSLNEDVSVMKMVIQVEMQTDVEKGVDTSVVPTDTLDSWIDDMLASV